jgi:deoxyadenosine/deoxycytidine kinase
LVISGIMGSGKTTLAFNLSQKLGWTYIQESSQALQYLSDLSNDPHRWAFESQVAFLAHKSIQILNALNKSQNIILDRSLYEDSAIFAYYHYQMGHLDQRAFETYSTIAEYFLRTVPIPDVIFLCLCSPETSEKRIVARGGSSQGQNLYRYLTDISLRYVDWVASYKSSSIYTINTEMVDLRQPAIIEHLVAEIEIVIKQQRESTPETNTLEVHRNLHMITPVFEINRIDETGATRNVGIKDKT